MNKTYYKYLLLTLAVVVLDQVTKLLVRNYMQLGEEFNVLGSWFRIHYVLNEGIAFGMKADFQYAKFVLTLFRILASGVGVYLIIKYSKEKIHTGALWAGALVLAGAIGNSIDSALYGVILDNAPHGASYKLFNGQVIDMLYFPLFEITWPGWIPLYAGKEFHFFNAIFNVADSSIFIGAVIMLLFQKKFFGENANKQEGNYVSDQGVSDRSMEDAICGTEDDCCTPT